MDVWNGTVYAQEALSRDPSEKSSIFSLFKKYQAIGPLRELKTLCFKKQIETARKRNLKKIFINVDFELLSHLDLVRLPENMEIVLEISELEALEDIQNHLEVAERWREFGYQFAIDDFGAGFISLPFLSLLVPEYIKIDRSAILRAGASEKFKQFLSDVRIKRVVYRISSIVSLRRFCRHGNAQEDQVNAACPRGGLAFMANWVLESRRAFRSV